MLRKELAMGCAVVALSAMLVGCAAPQPTVTAAPPTYTPAPPTDTPVPPTKTPIPPTATRTPSPQPSPSPTIEVSEAALLITVKSSQGYVLPCPSMHVCGGEVRHAFDYGDQVEATGYNTEFAYIQIRYPGGLGWINRGSLTMPGDVEELLPVVAWNRGETGGYFDLLYSPGHHVDVRLPETADGPFPTLLLLHGATFDKYSLSSLAGYFTVRGYAVVLANWLSGWPPDQSELSNAFCALAWLHTNAEEYGFDPERVAIFGHSAGGYAAVLLGAVDDSTEFMQDCPHLLPDTGRTQAVITYGGVFGAKEGTLLGRMMFQLPSDERDATYQILMDTPYQSWPAISGLSETGTEILHWLPFYWVDGSEPPLLLIHGEGDVRTPSPEPFAAQLQAAGVDARVVMIPDAMHTAILAINKSGFQSSCEAAEAFLTEVLE